MKKIISAPQKVKNACILNAKKLLKESYRMFKRKKWSFACFLAITSLEESQKLKLVYAYQTKSINEKILLKYWLDHKSKIKTINSFFVVDKDSTMELYLPENSTVSDIIADRNNCLYVGVNEGNITEPKSIGPVKAIQYINEANRELNEAISDKLLLLALKKHFKKIRVKSVLNT